MNRRHGYMLFALFATVLATWWAASLNDEDTSNGDVQAGNGTASAPAKAPVKATAGRGGKTLATNQAALLAQLAAADKSRSEPPKLSRDPFAVVSFQPPPPRPVVVVVKPTAPPLRFQYQGLLRDDDKLAVFLVDGTQFLIAREGETIAGQYKVVKVTENNMVLEYLPLHEQQTLNFGRL